MLFHWWVFTITPIITAINTYHELCLPFTSNALLELKYVQGSGWGYFAKSPRGIHFGDDLVTVPFSSCIPASMTIPGESMIELDLLERRSQLMTGDGAEVRLAAVLALLAHRNDYVDMMLAHAHEFPKPLEESMLRLLLEIAPSTAVRAKRYQQLAHAIFTTLMRVHTHVISTDHEEIARLSDLAWNSFFLVTSRSFLLHSKSHENKTIWMVPCVDLFNHHVQSPSARFMSNHTLDAVIVRAVQRVEPGKEVFVSYGPKTSTDLFLQYGFVVPDNGNDIVYLDIDTKRFHRDPNFDTKMKIVDAITGSRRRLGLGHRGLDADSLSLVRMLMLPPSQFSSYELANVLGRHMPPTSLELETASALYILEAVREQLMKYFNVMENDVDFVNVLQEAPQRVTELLDENTRILAKAYKKLRGMMD